MPWLTIIVTLVSFFLAGGADKEKRGKAALIAAAAGAGTYYTTNHTEWGQENLGFLDGVEVTTNPDGTTSVVNGPTGKPAVLPTPGQIAATQGTNPSGNGFWSSLTGWLTSPAGQITTGVAAGSALGTPKWVLLAGAGLAAYLLLKD